MAIMQPKWVEVWAHIYLGKIFDISGQRERAVNEYTQAQRTRDNTQGAQDEVAKYLRTPYKTPEQRSGFSIMTVTGEMRRVCCDRRAAERIPQYKLSSGLRLP